MSINPLDQPAFHFGDMRCTYSANQIASLVAEGITSPDTLVYPTDAVAFKAGAVAQHGLPPLAELVAE